MSTSSEPARRYGGQSADDRRTERRARLVTATISVLGGRGENATTMSAICVEAGLTERYFYESFRGREAALVAALDTVSDEIAVVVVQAIEHTGGPATARVLAALTALVAWVDDHPVSARVALVESNAHPTLRARRRELLGIFADLVVSEAAGLYGPSTWTAARARAQGLLYVAGLAELVTARLAGELDLTNAELVAIGSESFEHLAQS
ncbi:TetR/AcrR family transcriptional regulator [Aeromicrobium sp. Leaf350]|uniref:TetR/AcrR family transcriptional regulator n=1 Tax=Aeromicrobium sp. Leaf350 TaxID=2876565 RepID=UPI001E4B9D08|nr:TetR/AcrR family transcriptional regulator [Aeromicrobium sp. Leaf350]